MKSVVKHIHTEAMRLVDVHFCPIGVVSHIDFRPPITLIFWKPEMVKAVLSQPSWGSFSLDRTSDSIMEMKVKMPRFDDEAWDVYSAIADGCIDYGT